MGERIVGRSSEGNVEIDRTVRTVRIDGMGIVPDRNAQEITMRINVDFNRDNRADAVLRVTGFQDPTTPAGATLVSPNYDPLLYSPGLGRVLLNAGLSQHDGVLDDDSTRRIIEGARSAIRDSNVLRSQNTASRQ